jgi:hypothetical protein
MTEGETLTAIAEAEFEAGAGGDMFRDMYDQERRERDIFQYAEDIKNDVLQYADTVGILEYTHEKNGAVHELTGTGGNIKFTATAGYALGDTFSVNGAACAVRTTDGGEGIENGAFAAGAVVSGFLVDGVLYLNNVKSYYGGPVQIPGIGGVDTTNLLVRRLDTNTVYIDGFIPITSGAPEAMTRFATLPEGYRPLTRAQAPNGGTIRVGAGSVMTPCRVDVGANGEIFYRFPVGQGAFPGNGYLYIYAILYVPL